MNTHAPEFSPAEVLVSAFYIYSGYFIATVAVGIIGFFGEDAFTTLAGVVSMLFLGRVWLKQTQSRTHYVNLVLAMVAAIIALDIAANITS
ncbi:hypothetical protein ACXYL9_09230 [Qipengyuania sp. CAU 1752]